MVAAATTEKKRMAKKSAKSAKSAKAEPSPREDLCAANPTLRTALQHIEKQFDEGAIMVLGENQHRKIEGVPTGCLSLDIALGGSGLPRGRVVEMYGPESSGKTTLALHVAAEAQKQGGIAAIIDAEHAFDATWAKKIGVTLETLLVSQPSHGEEAMQITETLVKSNAVDVIIIDSVAALIPRAELEGEIGDHHVGLQARLMSQSLRKLTGAIARSKAVVIFINQIREKIGVMFGSPETTPGGRALKFYSSCRVDVRRIGALKDKDETVGQRVRAKIVKNKVAPPFRTAEFDMMHTGGVSYEGDILDMAVAEGFVQRSGSYFKINGDTIGQGKENSRTYLLENPEVTEDLRVKILVAKGIIADESAPDTTEVAASEEPKK